MVGTNVVAKSFEVTTISVMLDGTNDILVRDSEQEPSQPHSDSDMTNDD